MKKYSITKSINFYWVIREVDGNKMPVARKESKKAVLESIEKLKKRDSIIADFIENMNKLMEN